MGKRIKEARETTELSAIEMSNNLNIEPPTYRMYERGDRKMPPHTMSPFTEITKYSSDWLYLGTGRKQASVSGVSDYEQKMIDDIKNLDEKERNAIQTLIDSMKGARE